MVVRVGQHDEFEAAPTLQESCRNCRCPRLFCRTTLQERFVAGHAVIGVPSTRVLILEGFDEIRVERCDLRGGLVLSQLSTHPVRCVVVGVS